MTDRGILRRVVGGGSMTSLYAAGVSRVPLKFAFTDSPNWPKLFRLEPPVGDLLAKGIGSQAKSFGGFAECKHGRGGYRSGRDRVSSRLPAGLPKRSRRWLPAPSFDLIPSRRPTRAVAPQRADLSTRCGGPVPCAGLTPIGVSSVRRCTLRRRRENVKRLSR